MTNSQAYFYALGLCRSLLVGRLQSVTLTARCDLVLEWVAAELNQTDGGCDDAFSVDALGAALKPFFPQLAEKVPFCHIYSLNKACPKAVMKR